MRPQNPPPGAKPPLFVKGFPFTAAIELIVEIVLFYEFVAALLKSAFAPVACPKADTRLGFGKTPRDFNLR